MAMAVTVVTDATRPGPGGGRARPTGWLAALALAVALAAVPAAAAENDPLESLNRGVFAVNRVLDGLILRPAAILYRGIVPRPVRRGVHNFLGNLASPVIFANNVLQGDEAAAGNTFARFLVNSTIGLGGLIDVADGLGYERQSQDFGLTLGRWGLREGPYLMLPVLGPSSPRDLGGRVADGLGDPLTYLLPLEARIGRGGAEAVDFRERNLEAIDELERTSLDYYAAVRSIYRQQRRSALGLAPEQDDGYDDIFSDDFLDLE
jgi:phospholipid-binding lipoprotein MlaA